MKVSELLRSPSIKILTFLNQRGEARHSELERLLRSRGTLTTNLNDLIDEGLINRKVITSKPIQSNYSLSEKGRNVTRRLTELIDIL